MTSSPANDLPEGLYLWPIDEAQANRLSEMLQTDFPAMHITGTYVVGPQIKCEGCGKLSGLDDFVKGALKHGIHDTKFMINALKTSRENRTPAHKLACCVITTVKQTSWANFAKEAIGSGTTFFWTSAVEQTPAMRNWPRLRWLRKSDENTSEQVQADVNPQAEGEVGDEVAAKRR
ncbi:hypothetical protein FRB98_002469 [Tulasnella sp. 332]|nr:hypothetical protein FRB98_002469 [Tulasnella sp. 332]